MRALIYPYCTTLPWCKQFFPTRSFCNLPIVGRSYGERIIDGMQLVGTQAVLLLDYHFDYEYSQHLKQAKSWLCDVKYHGAPVCNNIRSIIEHHSLFAETEETIISFGPVLPDELAPEMFKMENLTPVAESDSASPGLYLLKGGILYRAKVPCLHIDSIQDFYELNLALLKNPRRHYMPGYGVENGVYLGINDTIKPGGKIEPPVLLGDNLILERDVNIEGEVIIGNNVMIARGNLLKRSVILDNTYIGPNMEFTCKIVDGNQVIDPLSGAHVEISELGIAGYFHTHNSMKNATGCVEYALALLLMLIYTLPWMLIYLPFRWMWNKTLWKYKLCLDCYPFLWKVLIGKGRFISIGRKHEPYVFTYGDAITNSRKNSPNVIINSYFRQYRSPWFSFKTTLKACVNRIFITHNPRARNENLEQLIKPFLDAISNK